MPAISQPTILKKLSGLFILLTMLVMALIAYFFLGQADIVITPNIRSFEINFSLVVSEASTDLTNNQIKGVILHKTMTGQDRFELSQTTEIKPSQARGAVTIVNNHTQEQTLVPTTRFLTANGILFRLENLAVIPAGSQLTGTVYAAEPGAAGNLTPPLRLTIPGLRQNLQDRIYALVDEPFRGGVINLGMLTETELAQASQMLLAELEEQAKIDFLSRFLQSFESAAGPVDPLIYTQTTLTQENTDATPGALIDSFVLDLTADFTAALIDRNELLNLAQNKLIASLSPDQKFLGLIPGSLTVTPQTIDPAAGQAWLEISLAGQSLYTSAGQIVDKSEIINKNKAELIDYFGRLPGVEKIEVMFKPFWVIKTPRLPSRIRLELQD